MLRIILFPAHFPQVLSHRATAGGEVLLRLESLLILGDLHQVFATCGHCLLYRGEADTCALLVLSQRSRAYYFLPHIQAVTIRTGRCRLAVCAKQHMFATVLRVITRLC